MKDKNDCESRHGSGTIWWTRDGKPNNRFTGQWAHGWRTSGVLYFDDEFGTQHDGAYLNHRANGLGERRYTKGEWEGISLRGSWANDRLQSVSNATLPKRLSTMSATKLLILADQWAQAGYTDSPAAIYRWITASADETVALKAADRLKDLLANQRRLAEAKEPAPQEALRFVVEYTYVCECECGQSMLALPKELRRFTVTAASKDQAEAEAYDVYGKGPEDSKNQTVSLGNCPSCYCNRSD